MFRWLFRVCRWVFEVADLGVQLTVGWTVAFGAMMAALAWIWGLVLEWGPFSMAAAFLVAILAMIAFEEGEKAWGKWRRRNQKALKTLRALNELTEVGANLIYRRKRAPYDADIEPVSDEMLEQWRAACENVVSEVSFGELYGLRSVYEYDAFYEKLRLITMRYAQKHPFPAAEVAPNVTRKTPQP